MRHCVAFAVGFLLLVCGASHAKAQEPTCVVGLAGGPTGWIDGAYDAPGGALVVAANGLFRYAAPGIVPVPGEEPGPINDTRATQHGLLLAGANGFFRYDGMSIAPVGGAPTGVVSRFVDVPGGLLLAGADRLYRYDGTTTVPVENEATGAIAAFHNAPDGVLVAAENGLFRYDNARLTRVAGPPTGSVEYFHDASGTLLVVASLGLFRYENGAVVRVPGYPPGSVWSDAFRETPAGLLVQTNSGLFRYDAGRVVRVGGDPTDRVFRSHDAAGTVLLAADKGLFRFDGSRVTRVAGDWTGSVTDLHATAGGLLVAASQGLFRYDGGRVSRVGGEPTGGVTVFHDVTNGVLVIADKGLFRFDGARIVGVGGDPAGTVTDFDDTPGGLLLRGDDGVFRYIDGRIVRVAGEPTGNVHQFLPVPDGMLVIADKGVFRLILRPLASARISLANAAALRGAAPSKLGIRTRWAMQHPCSAYAAQLHLHVVATNAQGEPGATEPAVGFAPVGDTEQFEATIPIPDAGKWSFRVVSSMTGTNTAVGEPAADVTFVTPAASGLLAWLDAWWRALAAGAGVLLAAVNLAVFAAARYSPAAWRLATDQSWGKTALLPQRLLLRHWRAAQLWLLDLYVRERRKALARRPDVFLALPLTGSDARVADSNEVFANFASARHVWIEGGTGMGKTAIFLHLVHRHFAATEATARAIWRRDGYILVAFEARRFPEAHADDKGASAWVIGCVLSILSEGGLSFDDQGLLRAMLGMGTLAVAVDGLNEVARGPAVLAFAAEFPAAPLFVTSHESAGLPFDVWHLPATISEHVDGLLTLYLGQQQGAALASRLRRTGLVQHLRSGYDVRLVIDLARSEPTGAALPADRLGLYDAAVAAAWPANDDRLELLQAAAWKLVSERGPNEDKRRLKPDVDAPGDLLEQLEMARERSGRSIRLIRATPSGYEFIHDQMNAYLAACWLADRPTLSVMRDLLEASKVWQDGLEAQRTLWGFVAARLDLVQLEALWIFAGDDDRRAVLGRALAERAEREGRSLTRPPARTADAAAN